MLIGEVADATGVSTKALRYYEQRGLLHEPDRTTGGYRSYAPEIVDRAFALGIGHESYAIAFVSTSPAQRSG